MRIAVIGTGYVGLVSAVCFAELGFDVIGVDQDSEKIARLKQGISPIFEPGLEPLLARTMSNGHLHFTTELAEAMDHAEAVFLAVGTPSLPNGDADLRSIFAAAEAVARHAPADREVVVVTKSTVPVGTGRKIAATIAAANPAARVAIASNPEFLREGCAVNDFLTPDRVVIGSDSALAKQVLGALYAPLAQQGVPIVFTALETAELIKYAANSFLATKIAFINEMADLCEALGADVQEVAHAIGLDKRIGGMFLQAGPGFGGSCFPKDMLALRHTAQQIGVPSRIIDMVITANDDRRSAMIKKITDACGGSVAGKTLAVLGLTFKANTDDTRNSPAIPIVEALAKAGATLRLYDPQGMKEAQHMLSSAAHHAYYWASSAQDALQQAEAAIILTEWKEFATLDLAAAHTAMRQPLVIDLRNLYAREAMEKAGFTYISVGRKPVMKAASTHIGAKFSATN